MSAIFFLATLTAVAQTIQFQPASPTPSITPGSTGPVTVGSVSTAPAGTSIVLSSYDPLVWLPTGSSCAGKQGSVLVSSPASVDVCVDTHTPQGWHVLFFSASTINGAAFAGLPLKVGAGSVTADQPTVSLVGATTTKDINVSVSGGATIQSVLASTAQPGVGDWLAGGGNCIGRTSCKATVTVNPGNLRSPNAGTTYIGQLTFTASDGTVFDVLVQYQYQASGASAITIGSPGTLNGFVDESFNAGLIATGGTTPYTWSATGLPSGLTISPAGVVSGSVPTAGSTQANITATDATGASKTQAVTFVFRTQATAVAQQVFTHVPSNPDGWQTDLLLFNTTAAPIAFTLRFHTDTGAPLPIEGVGTVSQISGTIPAHGTAFYRTSSTTRSDGWAEVDSAVPLSGVAIFRLHAPDGNYYEASDTLKAPSSGFTVPFDSTGFAGTSGYLTGLALANADPTQQAQLTCSVYDSSGNAIRTGLKGPSLPASGHTAFLLQQTAPFTELVSAARGQIVCTSNTQITAFALRALNYSVSTLPVVTQ